MEKAKGMVPEKNIPDDVSIPLPEADADSPGTASMKETHRCRHNSFNEHASSSPSDKIACLNWTSGRSQTNDTIEDWTSRAVSVFEWILVGCSVAGLLVSFIRHLNPLMWRWCVLVLVIVCGRHFMEWMMMRVKDSLVKRIFKFLKGNAHYSYYIYGLGKSVGVFLWFALILLTWYLLLDTSRMLKNWSSDEIWNFIRSNLITLVIVGALWVVKTFLVNKLSSSFQVTRYFDWIRNSLINQHILEVFEGSTMTVQNLINELEIGEKNQGVICRLLNMDPEEVAAWTMVELINMIRPNKLSSITKELENLIDDEDFMAKLEYEGKVPELDTAADPIFSKMNPPSGERTICKNDLIRLCSSGEKEAAEKEAAEKEAAKKEAAKKEAAAMIQQINGQKLVPRYYDYPSENQIKEVSCEALKMWLVHATVERRTLVQSINDMKSAIKELNELFSSVVLILLVVIWSLMVGLLTRDGLVLLLSQIFFFTFIFGSTARNAFEGIIFVFVKHPFDIGDLCLINREEVVVEKINLFTTIFRKKNKDKLCYSNSVLSTMPIINFYRVNTYTRVSLEFTTEWPIERVGGINSLRDRINERLCKDQQKEWFPKCNLVVKELEDEKKAKMVLFVTYRNLNIHKSGVATIWMRHKLIIALNQFLGKLNIKHCKIRPQEVDYMENTAKPQSTEETNQQSNGSKFEASTSELNRDTATVS
ncbi:hypothetical protein SLA2020_525280 [Shorea laevis]